MSGLKGSYDSAYDKVDARKQFKALAGDRVRLISSGLEGTITSVRPTVVNGMTGEVNTGYTIVLDIGLNGVQSWPVTVRVDDFEEVL